MPFNIEEEITFLFHLISLYSVLFYFLLFLVELWDMLCGAIRYLKIMYVELWDMLYVRFSDICYVDE